MTERQKVEVYVRRGSGENGDRQLSFRIPEALTQGDILDQGWAIDGNQALMAVTDWNNGERYIPVAESLHDTQVELRNWFEKEGYEVIFR